MDNRTIDEIRNNETKLIRDIFKLEKELESKRKEYQETYKDVRIELKEKNQQIDRLNNIIAELEKYHIKSMENLKNTEDFKYVGINHIKILYEEHKRALDKLKELKEGKK